MEFFALDRVLLFFADLTPDLLIFRLDPLKPFFPFDVFPWSFTFFFEVTRFTLRLLLVAGAFSIGSVSS